MAAVTVVAVGVGLYAFLNSSAPAVDPTNTTPLEQALTRVPAADVPGQDIPKVPRPTGTVRTYYLSNSAVTTVVYTRHGAVADVRPPIEAALERNGWGGLGSATPAPGGTTQRTWQQVYSDGTQVLQVQVFTHNDTVAAIYVLQRTKAGQ